MNCMPTCVGWMDRWATYDFTSFSTVFQSYQDDGRVIMKDHAMEPSLHLKSFVPLDRLISSPKLNSLRPVVEGKA